MDFALILFVLSVLSGILWCYDVFKARKIRRDRLQELFASALESKRKGDIGSAELLLTENGIRLSDARAALSAA